MRAGNDRRDGRGGRGVRVLENTVSDSILENYKNTVLDGVLVQEEPEVSA
jgi:hypothetical protein